jgi:nicotinate phosphoribosyltransferase
MAIIKSLLDTDLYKFTMLQVVLHKFPQTHSVYAFRCRNLEDTAYPLSTLLDEINAELDALCELRFTADELQYLRGLRFIKSDFVDYLELFQLKRRFIKATIDAEGRLDIRIEGSMIQAMMFEIYVLAIVNELYFSHLDQQSAWQVGEQRLNDKIILLQDYRRQMAAYDVPFLVSDFGTRRRYSVAWQEQVLERLMTVPEIFRGTIVKTVI